MTILDAGPLRALAADLDERAAQLEHQHALLRSAADQLHWHSPAATAFGFALLASLRQLAGASERLRQLAVSLRRHGSNAEEHARLVEEVAQAALSPVRGLAHLVGLP